MGKPTVGPTKILCKIFENVFTDFDVSSYLKIEIGIFLKKHSGRLVGRWGGMEVGLGCAGVKLDRY